MIYLANKVNGKYEYVGVDWNSGAIKAHWRFQDDDRKWTPTVASLRYWRMAIFSSEAPSPSSG